MRPQIVVTDEFLAAIRDDGIPGVTLDGDVLTFRKGRQTFVYRVYFDRYDFERNEYPAEWPD